MFRFPPLEWSSLSCGDALFPASQSIHANMMRFTVTKINNDFPNSFGRSL